MKKSSAREKKSKCTTHRWIQGRTNRVCTDGANVHVPSRTFRLFKTINWVTKVLPEEDDEAGPLAPRNGILYKVLSKNNCLCGLFVTEMKFDRSMSRIMEGVKDTRMTIFPNMVEKYFETTNWKLYSLSSALNGGL